MLVGSPGAGGGVDHASELGVGADHVWVGRNSEDLVAALGDHGWVGGRTLGGAGLGQRPVGGRLRRAPVPGRGRDPQRLHRGVGQHSNYFNVDTESLYNIGRVVDGHGGDVRLADHTYDPWYAGRGPRAGPHAHPDKPGYSDTVGN